MLNHVLNSSLSVGMTSVRNVRAPSAFRRVTLLALSALVFCQAVLVVVSPKQVKQKAVVAITPVVVDIVAPFHPARVSLGSAGAYSPPDFSQYVNTRQKKEAFYAYLLPMIRKANQEVVRERLWLLSMADVLLAGQSLRKDQLHAIEKIEQRYAIDSNSSADLSGALRIGELLRRVDVVPASLIVAQAAKESGWGTSRFATEGNNYFGIWCFYQGCGLKPLRRESGRGHEVATFGSVAEGVRYYVRTINTHVAYTDLRNVRATAKRSSKAAGGINLADGLLRYSERGMPYVREIQDIIRYNKMQKFTRNYSV